MTTSKGGKPATGSIKWQRCTSAVCAEQHEHPLGMPHWHGRVTKADGSRPFVPLDPGIAADDTDRARACAVETAEWFRENPQVDAGIRETVAQYVKRWLEERDGRVNSIRDDRGRMRNHVLPILGPLDASKFTRDDVERLRDDLDAKIRRGWSVGADDKRRKFTWKTAANVWTLVTSMADDMVNAKKRELRTRADDPTTNVKPPDRGGDRAKQYLYPSEFLRFVSCDAVPLRWRRAVALAVYTYTRDAELRVLEYGTDVDIEHGIVHITRAYNRRKPGQIKGTKSENVRSFSLESNLLPLLEAMHRQSGGKGLVVKLASERAMARNLRRWLWKANVRRPALHQDSPTSKKLTWHDLRATGITWLAVRGDLDALKIRDRAGHASVTTTEVYIRTADAIREGFGEPFPPLPADLLWPDPGLAAVRQKPNWRAVSSENAALFGGVDGTRTRSDEPHDSPEKQAPEPLPSPAPDAEPSRGPDGSLGASRRVAVPNAEPLATSQAALEEDPMSVLQAARGADEPPAKVVDLERARARLRASR